jgi:hypothetical protein
VAFGLTSAGAASVAAAQAVITNPDNLVSLGVFEEGHLNYQGIGVTYVPTGNDGTSPGCACEGWGAGVAGGEQGWASVANGGINNVTVQSFASTATTATSVVHIGSSLEVRHVYTPSSSPNLYRVDVTITNLTGATLGAGDRPIQYQRVMDWDIGPTEFDEFVTIQGSVGAANVLGTNSNGFGIPNLTLTPNPDCPTTFTGDFVRAGPCDHGANFLFGFDALDAGSSRTFTIFYGAAANQAEAIAALGTVGAEIYSLGQCNPDADAGDDCRTTAGDPNTFIFGFAGVGGTPLPPPSVVPEPGTVLLTATGLLGILVGVRRRRQS